MNNLNLTKLKPCNQYWDKMKPVTAGRKCSMCSHVIRDFRNRSLEEIARVHATSNEKVCGIYSDWQIGRKRNKTSLPLAKLTLPLLTATLSTFAINECIAKTENSNVYRMDLHPIDNNASKSDNGKPSTRAKLPYQTADIRGRVKAISGTDTTNCEGAYVSIKNTTIVTTTDSTGMFFLTIPYELAYADSLVLTIGFIGFSTEHVIIKPSHLEYIDVLLEEQTEISVFIVGRAPLHKRIWYWIKNLF